jgi:hypothetical protein
LTSLTGTDPDAWANPFEHGAGFRERGVTYGVVPCERTLPRAVDTAVFSSDSVASVSFFLALRGLDLLVLKPFWGNMIGRGRLCVAAPGLFSGKPAVRYCALRAHSDLKRVEAPRIRRPRQIQISCSSVFYGKREAKFQRNLEIL